MTSEREGGPEAPDASGRARLAAEAYPPWGRLAAALLVAVSGASAAVIVVLIVVASDPPVTPPVLVRLVALYAALPGLAGWLLGRAFAAEVEVRGGELLVQRRDVRVEVPGEAVAAVVPWTVPLPSPGVWLQLRSGRRLRPGLAAPNPSALLEALAAAGVAAARPALAHPTLVYARARARAGATRWYHPAAKFGLFALGPAAVLFYSHQHIAYGGTLGEYYLLGLASYLQTLAVHWGTVTIYLVLWASLLRGAAEGIALLAAWVAPSRAARVRPAVELANRLLYYGGVPVLLLLRYLS